MLMKQLKEDIKGRSFHPVYLLYGEERYLVRQYKELLKQAVLDGGDEMNYTGFEGSGVNLLEVEEIADTLPFFHDYRIVIWEESGLFKSANDFTEYLPQMPDTTILLFVEKAVDKRNKLYKYVQKNGLAVEMAAMNTADTKKFVAMKLRDSGRKIRESTVCSVQVTGQMFKMLDAAAAGQKQELMQYYHDLLELKESPMSILYLLTRHFNILLQVKAVSGSLSKQETAKKIGIPPFSVGKYQAQCRRFTRERLKEMLQLCVNTEFDFKQGRLSDRIGVEMLLVTLLDSRHA